MKSLEDWKKEFPPVHDVPDEILSGVREVESAGNDQAYNKATGAIGPMQLIPRTLGLAEKELKDVGTNVEVGGRYLEKLYHQFGGDMERALRAYNQGPGNERKREGTAAPTETQQYPGKVMAAAERYKPRPDSEQGLASRHPEATPAAEDNYTLADAARDGATPMEWFKRKHPVKWAQDQIETATKGAEKMVGALLPDTAGGKELAKAVATQAPELTGVPSALRLAGKVGEGTPVVTHGKYGRVKDATLFDPDLVDTAMMAAPFAGKALRAGEEVLSAAPKVGRAAQRGYIRGTMAEGAESPEARAARWRARNVPNPGTQTAAFAQSAMGTTPDQRWFQGGDKKWRNEVADNEARVTIGDKYDIPTVLKKNKKVEMTLADAYDHPELFKDYPALAKYRVVINPKLEKNYRGAFSADSNVIEISPNLLTDPQQLKETIVHEVQHAVDDLEGTSAGAPLNWLKRKYGAEEGTRRYRNNAGEAGARSQENRMNMTPQERAAGPHPFSNSQTEANYRELDWSKDSTGAAQKGPYPSEMKPTPMGEALKDEDYTLKTLERLPMNKVMIPVQTVRDQLKRGDVSKAEKDILEGILPMEGSVNPADLVEKFKKATTDYRTKPSNTDQFASYGLEHIGRNTDQWGVGELPSVDDLMNLEGMTREEATAELHRLDPSGKGAENARTTIHQLPEGVSGSTANHFRDPNYFGHTRAFEEGGIPHVVEVQSDLMQKSKAPLTLEKRAELQGHYENVDSQLQLITSSLPQGGPRTAQQYEELIPKVEAFNEDAKLKLGQEVQRMNGYNGDPWEALDKALKDAQSTDKTISNPAKQDLMYAFDAYTANLRVLRSEHEAKLGEAGAKDLTPLKKTHQQRLVREELAMAAKDGQPTVRFASPDTVAKVEGWPQPAENARERIARNKKKIKDLQKDDQSRDGREVQSLKDLIENDEEILKNLGPARFKKEHQGIYDNYAELEEYLRSIGGTPHTDAHGHTWTEVTVKGEKSPLKEGRTPLFSMTGAPLATGAAAQYNATKPEGTSK